MAMMTGLRRTVRQMFGLGGAPIRFVRGKIIDLWGYFLLALTFFASSAAVSAMTLLDMQRTSRIEYDLQLRILTLTLGASAQTLAAMAASDETVKAAMACYAFEQLEVAAYTSLFAAAHQSGDIQCQRMCDQLLQQERDMAAWLRGNLPQLTQAFMTRDAAADRSVTTQSMAPGAPQPPGGGRP